MINCQNIIFLKNDQRKFLLYIYIVGKPDEHVIQLSIKLNQKEYCVTSKYRIYQLITIVAT